MLVGSGKLERYWDHNWEKWLVNLAQGDYAVSDEPILLTTVLGSCVAACVYSPERKMGGINHFLLPHAGASDAGSGSFRYGIHAMEVLINSLLRKGADRDELQMKVCGAADVVRGLSNRVGVANATFIRLYAKQEHLNLLAEDLGGDNPRRVVFDPQTGSMKVKRLTKHLSTEEVLKETARAEKLEQKILDSADVELFGGSKETKR